METYKNLSFLKDLYQKGENIISFLKNKNHASLNSVENILISYDFQAGSYTKNYEKNKEFVQKYANAISETIEKYIDTTESILEVGVGEATVFGNVIKSLKTSPKNLYGFDISWSRIKYAKSFLEKLQINNSSLFVGDLFNIPLKDNSIDVVYTSHSIEPNGGREREALLELYRIAKKYVVLLEPCYELASDKARERMRSHGYISNMYNVIKNLNYNVKEFRLFDFYSNPLNPTGLTVIQKNTSIVSTTEYPWQCPVTKTDLKMVRGSFFSPVGLLAYPIIDKIPCLLQNSAIVATHYMDNGE